MRPLAFTRVAITAFLEPAGFGPLLVWSISARALYELCAERSAFDPSCEIEALLLGGCQSGAHPGRQALEDHCRAALAWPDPPHGLLSGSALGQRSAALVGSQSSSRDLMAGFLDLLIHVPPEASLPRSARQRPDESLARSFHALWGRRPTYCGQVSELDWETYDERAAAVMRLMEATEIARACAEASREAESKSRGRL